MSASSITQFLTQVKQIKDYILENKWKSIIALGSCSIALHLTRFICNKLERKIRKYPPGPEGLPFIGYGLSAMFNQTWHINVAMTYGPVVFLRTFSGNSVLINDSKIAKQLLSRKDMQNRDNSILTNTYNIFHETELPFFLMNGKEWIKWRQFFHSKLIRILNTKYVNEILTELIENKLEPYLENIIKNESGLWYPRNITTELAFNTIYQANFGTSADMKNDKLCNEFSKDMKYMMSPSVGFRLLLLFAFPFLKFSSLVVNPLRELRNRLNYNTKELIEKRKIENDENKNDNEDTMTFIDYTSRLRAENKMSEGREIVDIINMFMTGTDTTSSTLEYGIVLLAKQPNIQEIVRKELKNVIGDWTVHTLFDIKLLLKIPLFRALIQEILRISCISRMGVQHFVTSDNICINNYQLPKYSYVFINIDFIHNYSKTENWKSTKEICLENWLDSDNKFYMNESFMAFGYGIRDCPGQQLVMKELRVILGYLLLNYKFSLKDVNQTIKEIGGHGLETVSMEPQIPVLVEKIV